MKFSSIHGGWGGGEGREFVKRLVQNGKVSYTPCRFNGYNPKGNQSQTGWDNKGGGTERVKNRTQDLSLDKERVGVAYRNNGGRPEPVIDSNKEGARLKDLRSKLDLFYNKRTGDKDRRESANPETRGS